MARRRRFQVPDILPTDPFETRIPEPLPEHPSERFTSADAGELRKLVEEQGRREVESLRLYQPLPKTEIFHSTEASIRLIIGSNRGGKTLGASVEFARVITGQDPYNKYPKENGVAFVFGLDGRHIGNTIYKKVFRPGAFKIIRDEVTGQWRGYNPLTDKARAHLCKPAPPLVPKRFIKSIAWEEKKAHIPKIITMTNGWEIHFYSSQAELPQGQDIDLWWIDEEVKRENVIEELLPRCADRRGKGIWSATPQVASAQLFDLHDRATSGQALTDNASISNDGDVVEIHVHILDNPYIDSAEKEKLFRGWTEEQRKVRWDGKFAFSSFLIYPEFNLSVHAWPQNAGWQVPHDWSHYLAVDPGRQRCAVLFLAVAPPYQEQVVVAYDECYIKDCDAEIFGRSVAQRSSGRVFEAAIIDSHAGRINEMASGKNIEEQYRQALVRHRFQMRNGVHFTWGSDDVEAGIQAVRDWLRVAANGRPKFFIHVAKCPNLRWEFERYRYKPDPQTKLPSDMPVKKNDHLMDTARYLALFNPPWRKPKAPHKIMSPAVNAMQRKKDRQAQKNGGKESRGISLSIGRSSP